MRRSQNARTGTRAARTRCGLRKFDVSSVPATACGSFHLPQGASIRLSGWRGFRAGSGGLQSVPKISIFGTHILERPNSANAGFLRSHFRRVFGTGICCPRCVTPLARSATISRSDDIYRGGDGSVDLPALGSRSPSCAFIFFRFSLFLARKRLEPFQCSEPANTRSG
jgi:hypothetical protein